jgi:hypothetical protein
VTRDNNIIYRFGTIYRPLGSATDISGKVDKVTGKSLILDSEISRLAGVDNHTLLITRLVLLHKMQSFCN